MRQIIALTVILMVGCLAGLFTWFAWAIRRDVRERFERIQRQLDDQANTLVGHLFRHRDMHDGQPDSRQRLSDR